MVSAYIYQAAWESKLAQRLDKPQNWKEVMDVVYTDTQATNFPLISTGNEPAVTTLTNTSAGRSLLSNVIPFAILTQTNETLSIVTAEIDSVYLDYADQAQSQYSNWADMGDLLGKKINERIEGIAQATQSLATNIGDTGGGVIGLSSTQIQVSATNIDDIIRGIIEQIQTANGFTKYQENGGFACWRPADWTFLVQFMQANGFATADSALQNGTKDQKGVPYMGLYHYVTTSNTANHVLAGVRKLCKLGLLKSTYGKTYTAEMPASSTAGSLSGTQIHTRVDYGTLLPTNMAPIYFDVNVV